MFRQVRSHFEVQWLWFGLNGLMQATYFQGSGQLTGNIQLCCLLCISGWLSVSNAQSLNIQKPFYNSIYYKKQCRYSKMVTVYLVAFVFISFRYGSLTTILKFTVSCYLNYTMVFTYVHSYNGMAETKLYWSGFDMVLCCTYLTYLPLAPLATQVEIRFSYQCTYVCA